MKLLQDGDIEASVKLVKRSARTVHYRAQTIVNTLRLGRSRGSAFDKALQSGVTKMKYVGSSFNIRPFCREHLNKTYTIDEIRDMDNGQGLPVAEFCGGHNCQHRWVPVIVPEVIEGIQNSKLEYSITDIKQDTRKHAPKFELDQEQYIEEARSVVRKAKEYYKQKHDGEDQYIFIGNRGYAVATINGTIKGYYHHEPKKIDFAIQKIKKIKGWKEL